MESKTPEELAQQYANACRPLIPYGIYNENDARRDAWLTGYAAALPKWVSVEERLPENNGSYAVIDCGLVRVLEYDTELGWRLALTEVTDWQPLPTKEP